MINKKEFSSAISEDMKITKKDAEAFVDSFLFVMTDYLMNGETVRFTGFGEFGTRELPARECVNPSTGEPVQVPPRIKPYFKAGKTLRNSL